MDKRPAGRASDPAQLAHCRAVLTRVTASLTVEDLDYRHFPDAKSNGEILLHIAGFEFVAICVAGLARDEAPDLALWPRLKPGFAREAGFLPPQGLELDTYIESLQAVRAQTVTFLGNGEDSQHIAAERIAVQQVAQLLAETDPSEDPDCYRRLAAGISTSFADDGAVNDAGMIDLVALLTLHETYHRGQITLNKYIRSRQLRGQLRR